MQTRNPCFDQTFEFDLSKHHSIIEDLNKLSLNFVIFDWNPIEKCEILGEVKTINEMVFKNENKVFISNLKIVK